MLKSVFQRTTPKMVTMRPAVRRMELIVTASHLSNFTTHILHTLTRDLKGSGSIRWLRKKAFEEE